MRKFSILVVVVLSAVFSTIAGELDSLQNVINQKCDSLYNGHWYGAQLQKLPVDSIPDYLSFLIEKHLVDSMTVYQIAQDIQKIALLQRKAAHIKVSCNLVEEWQGSNEARLHSHTVALIDNWFEKSAMDDEPRPTPVGRLHLDMPEMN